ncbi:Glucanosyltransferase-domain-containing protein [Lophiotrema nucula]|uniref:1,3-beta-glucanosyltransferase n=1 Tax=Lophiotrema nucula TaxID=690887 RepID=A0A6A5YK96_9PLEO|nr:Glucanosyltransferase-domain-containing protein [Lophiotrema nucula]
MSFGVSMRLWIAIALLCLSIIVQAQTDPVFIKGSKFFYQTNGSEFQLRGVTYEYGVDELADPLSDGAACERDVQYLLDLNLNLVQIDDLDPAADHSRCLQAFADAGIYILASFYTPTNFLAEFDPVWDDELYNHYAAVVDFLAPWNNTLGFTIELDSWRNGTDLTTYYISYVKAVTRGLKAYMKEKNYRDIPVGFRFAAFWPVEDDALDRRRLDYLNCADSDTHSDFLALELQNCPAEPDIDHIVRLYASSSIPLWVENLGCGDNNNASDPRTFTDSSHTFSQNVSQVLVGGVAYEFKYEDDSRLIDDSGSEVVKLAGYTVLSKAMATVTPPSRNAAQYTPSASTTTDCPTSNAAWSVPTNLPPEPFPKLCSCMMSSLPCVGKRSAIEPVSSDAIEDLFNPLCSTERTKCPGIRVSPHEGIFGAYSVCDSTERYSWAASYLMGKEGQDCDFGGNATSQTPATTLDDECHFLLNQVGTDGTGTITALSATASPTSTPSNSANAARPSKGGLSNAAKGGIAAGVVAFFLAALVAVFVLLRRRRKNRPPKAELSSDEVPATKYRYEPVEVGQGSVLEAPADNDLVTYPTKGDLATAEVDGNAIPSELDGTEPMVKTVRTEEPRVPTMPRWEEQK